MKHGVAAAVVVASVAVLGAQQAPVFRSSTQMVPVYVTAVDETGHLVTDLTRDEFEVLDNGRSQPIAQFSNAIQPISIVVMLDMSGSMLGNLPVLRQSAVQMFTRLLPEDQARVGGFGDRITLSERFTNDQNELIRALWSELTPGGSTPLWGAISVAMTALAHLEGRRVVLVLTDGKDTSGFWGDRPAITLPDVIRRAQVEEYLLYAIGMQSRSASGAPMGRFARDDEPDPGLRDLAAETGGGYFELHWTDPLGPTFARVADELHRQYLLGFVAPDADGKLHQITVNVQRSGVIVRARRSYLAPRKTGDAQ